VTWQSYGENLVMARPEVTGRKLKTRAGKTVREFCEDWNISEATFYAWKKAGLAPDVVQPAGPGGRQLITPEAEQEWKKARRAPAAVAAPAE
jgi:hypothetical protein